MKPRHVQIISFFLILAAFAAAYLVYPALPERVASHWGVNGEVDGYMSRFWGAFLMPFVMLGCWLIFLAVPYLDPKKENIAKFRPYFDVFILVFQFFLVYIFALTAAWNLGYRFELIRWLSPALALLFFVIGVMVGRAEPNWTIGIRTPWTLESPAVWRKTHALGGKLFMLAAAFALLGVFWPAAAVWFVLVPILAAALYLIIYSYALYRKEQRGGRA